MSYASELWDETRTMWRGAKEDPMSFIGEGPSTLGALRNAIKQDEWKPLAIGDEGSSSHDTLLGGPSAGGRRQRQTGRTVGTIFGVGALGKLIAGAGAGAESAGSGAFDPGASSMYSGEGANPYATAGDWTFTQGTPSSGYEWGLADPGVASGATGGGSAGTGSGSGAGSGNWFSNLFRSGGGSGSGAGSGSGGFNPYSSLGGAGIGALAGILNARQQKKDARAGEEDERRAVQQGTDAMARSLSIEGNPAGSGRALQQLQNYATIANSENARRRRAQMAAANNNMYGAGGFGMAAILSALANSGAFSGSGGGGGGTA